MAKCILFFPLYFLVAFPFWGVPEEETQAISSDCERQLKNLPRELKKEVSNVPATLEAVAYKGGCRGRPDTWPLMSQAEQTCTNLLGGLALRLRNLCVLRTRCPVNEQQRHGPRGAGSAPAGKMTAALLGEGRRVFRETEMLLSEKHPIGM